jgi:hypothetical protein
MLRLLTSRNLTPGDLDGRWASVPAIAVPFQRVTTR